PLPPPPRRPPAAHARMWQDGEAQRAEALRSIGPGADAEARLRGLAGLRALALAGHREELWADEELRRELLTAIEDDEQSEAVRAAALCVVKSAAASVANQLSVLKSSKSRNAMVQACRLSEPSSVRQPAGLILAVLAVAAVGAEPPGATKDIHRALASAAHVDEPAHNRAAVFAALWSSVALGARARELLSPVHGLRDVLIESGRSEQPPQVRLNVIGALWAMAKDEPSRHQLWVDPDIRDILVDGAGSGNCSSVRLNALGALRSLACEDDNRAEMCGSPVLIGHLKDALAEQSAPSIRSAALEVVLQLSMCGENHLPLHEERLHDTLLAASRDPTFSAHDQRMANSGYERIVVGKIVSLSWMILGDDSRKKMWTDPAQRKMMLSGASPGQTDEIRLQYLRLLDDLAIAFANQKSMWNNSDAVELMKSTVAAGNPLALRVVAIRWMLHLTACEPILPAMYDDCVQDILGALSEDGSLYDQVRASCAAGRHNILAGKVGALQPARVRAPAVRLLEDLARAPGNRRWMLAEERLAASLLANADVKQPAEVRNAAVEALASLSREALNAADLFVAGVHCTFLEASQDLSLEAGFRGSCMDSHVRVVAGALGHFQGQAADDAGREQLWHDKVGRRALMEGVADIEPPQTRALAFSMIRDIAMCRPLQEEVCEDAPLSKALLASVGGEEAAEVRESALAVFAVLLNRDCHAELVKNGVHQVLSQSAEDPLLSADCREACARGYGRLTGDD
ncbi:unnamed protein product, partial [Prorocentrum cordatum]